MAANSNQTQGEITRDRILDAAMRRFAQASYERVSLRQIAGDVGVDVALVHRSFGSKKQLFEEAFRRSIRLDHLLGAERSELSDAVSRSIHEGVPGDDAAVNPLHIFVHSLTSAEAADSLRQFVSEDLIAPLSKKLDDPSGLRAGLLVASLAGIHVLRDVLEVDASLTEHDPLFAELFSACVGEPEEVSA